LEHFATTLSRKRKPLFIFRPVDSCGLASSELVEIHAQLVGFTVEEKVFPSDLALLVASHAAEHAAKRSLDTCTNLIVRTARGDAFDEGAIFISVGEGEVVRKAAIDGKLAGASGGTDLGVLPTPGLCAKGWTGPQ
jgi:hypothetical protein